MEFSLRDGDLDKEGRVLLAGAYHRFGPQQKRLLLWILSKHNGNVEDAIHELGLSGDDHLNKLLHDLRDSLWSARLLRDEPDEIVAAHRAYVDAGADVAITASYHASYAGFANAGIDADEATRLLALSVDLARRAQPADRQTFVAGSVGLYGVVWANGTEYTGDYSRATDDDVALSTSESTSEATNYKKSHAEIQAFSSVKS